MARSKLSAQSDPVDPVELHRRLELVIREREERKARRMVAQHAKQDDLPAIDRPQISAKQSYTPPPPTTLPTAFPTRPVSQLPDINDARPRSVLLQRESIGNRLSVNVVPGIPQQTAPAGKFVDPVAPNLQELGQATRLGAKTTSRPSTSWHVERHARTVAYEEEEIGLAISSRIPKRPKSMSYLNNEEPLPVVVTEGPVLAKHNSTRRGEVKSQSVQVIDLAHYSPHTAPITTLLDDGSHTLPNLTPLTTTIDNLNTSIPVSGLSSATTALNHSVKHSLEHSISTEAKNDRRSWNPRNLLSKLKDRNCSMDKVIVPHLLEHRTPISPIFPIHEIMLDPIPPIHDAQLVSLSSRASPQLDSPKARPHTNAFEPFFFRDHRFSGLSDIESVRMSDSHMQFKYSDFDSALGGMSDTTSHLAMSNMSSESIPTLMPGAEKRPDWNKSESPAMRDSKVPSTIFLGPFDTLPSPRIPQRESSLRNEVATPAPLLHVDTTVSLQAEPPEDEGIYIQSPQENTNDGLGIANQSYAQTSNNATQIPAAQVSLDTSSKPNLRKRRSLNPRKLFSASKLFSSSTNHIPLPKTTSISHKSDFPSEPTTVRHSQSLHPTRPSSRSQPILIPDYDPTIPVPSFTMPASPTHKHKARSSSSFSNPRPYIHHNDNRTRSTSNKLIAPHPPDVPTHELQQMTSESVALLRAQEQLLIRRSTMQLAEVHVAAIESQFRPNQEHEGHVEIQSSDEIGLAMPFDDSRASTALAMNPQVQSQGYIIDAATGMQSVLPPLDTEDKEKRFRDSSSSHIRGLSTGAFFTTKPLEPWETTVTSVGRVPGGSKSMVDLPRTSKRRGRNGSVVGVRKAKDLKRGWWKVWRLV